MQKRGNAYGTRCGGRWKELSRNSGGGRERREWELAPVECALLAIMQISQ